jgi:hypothetical protein
MANTYELITSYAATGTVSSIDFSSIPSTYTDLVLKLSLRVNAGSGGYQTYIRFNGDTGSNYNWKNALGTGTSALSQNPGASDTGMRITISDSSGDTASTFSNAEIYIPNYAGSAYKAVSADGASENNAAAATLDLASGIWNSTSAINAISIFASGASLVQYSTAYLYGVKNA